MVIFIHMKIHQRFVCISVILLLSCGKSKPAPCVLKKFEVTASAYNSLAYQTSSNPSITAFGDSLYPGLRYIAVSRDLIDSGLVHNTKVKLQGFDSLYTVKDKMNKRWQKRIDIYMGKDIKKAKAWGRQQLTIEYCIPLTDSVITQNALR